MSVIESPAKEILLNTLKVRFEANMHRHAGLDWGIVLARLSGNRNKLWSLSQMERTGGEPDIISLANSSGELVFVDCSTESPEGRRNICYDQAALDARKQFKPKDSALNMAATMGIEILDEEGYRSLQELGKFDIRTSSWIKTPASIRKLGGALFADRRYEHVFIYHNGAESYYAARGFRGMLKV